MMMLDGNGHLQYKKNTRKWHESHFLTMAYLIYADEFLFEKKK